MEEALPFDIVFADSCVGGSTVASQLARTRNGLRAFYLADYAVNPLGVKSREAVQEALNRWVDAAVGRAEELVIACNTASVRLRGTPEVVDRARSLGIRVHSMADFLEEMLEGGGPEVEGKRVCLMGTEFTVGQPLYRDRLSGAGASAVLPLAATLTERTIPHLEHESPDGRKTILEEIRETLEKADVVVLACTCFPMVEELIREVNPSITLLDPALGVEGLGELKGGEGPNRLTVALTGDVLSPQELQAQFPQLFPGWELEAVLKLEIAPLPPSGREEEDDHDNALA